jgi:hypothetical protein
MAHPGVGLTGFSGFLDLASYGSPATNEVPVTTLGQGDTISQARGTTRRYRVPLVDPADATPLQGVFDDATAIRLFVWAGGSGPTLATPSVFWEDAPGGIASFDVTPDDLASLELQPYPIRIEVDRGGFWQEAWDGWLDVVAEPATAPAPYVPGTYQEMVDKGGLAVRQLLTADEGAGFLRPRLEAWQYLRQVILARYRPYGGNRGSAAYSGFLPGYWGSIDAPNPIIAGYLDSGKLLVTDQVREILARKALAILFDRQLDDQWSKRARREHARADLLIQSLAAGIDLTGNGFSDITINCGIFNTRDI